MIFSKTVQKKYTPPTNQIVGETQETISTELRETELTTYQENMSFLTQMVELIEGYQNASFQLRM